jgi:phosphopantetheinyl transferase (holo-ACP synthase)
MISKKLMLDESTDSQSTKKRINVNAEVFAYEEAKFKALMDLDGVTSKQIRESLDIELNRG